MNAAKAKIVRVSIAKNVGLLDLFRKGRSRMDIEICLNDEKDEIPLAILCPSLQLPELITFEDYVNIAMSRLMNN